jgi:hypothetical protein
MTAITLKTVIFIGSAQSVVPLWGGDACLGNRVTNWVESTLTDRNKPLGKDLTPTKYIANPIKVFGPNGALSHSGGAQCTPFSRILHHFLWRRRNCRK